MSRLIYRYPGAEFSETSSGAAAGMSVKCEGVSYGGWNNCQQVSNGTIKLIVTTDVGPRVIWCGFEDGENLFCQIPEDLGKTGGDEWRPYGGHRLWHAPEVKPRTYAPDNSPVHHTCEEGTLRLRPEKEELTGIRKEMDIRVHEGKPRVTVTHRLVNEGLWDVRCAAWSLTVMRSGGTAVLPQEPFVPFPTALLPARPLVLWPYTNMADPRFTWGERHIELRQDSGMEDKPQKIGVLNSLGWGAYLVGTEAFAKFTSLTPGAEYPDFGCNWEVYTNKVMLEMETLSPLVTLAAQGGCVEHREEWLLLKDVSGAPAALCEQLVHRDWSTE